MKQILCLVLTAMMFLAMLPAAYAETLTGLTAAEIVAQMGIGWNLGNTFDAYHGNTWDVYSQEKSWGNPQVDEAMIKRVKDAGFKTIRIPVTWFKQLSKDGHYTVNAAFMNRVKEVVDMAYNEGLYIIINMHHEEWLNSKALDKDYEKIGVQLAAVWRQIADIFADYDQRLIFEGMNEPRMAGAGDVEWNGNDAGRAAVNYLNQVFVDTVRTDAKGYNGERALMIPTYAASNSAINMYSLQIPEWNGAQAENIIVSIHSYSPYKFCLTDEKNNFSLNNQSDLKEVNDVFKRARDHFLSKEIPVVIGETGATNSYNNVEARGDWAYYTGWQAAYFGIPVCIWDNGSKGTSNGERHTWLSRRATEENPFPTVLNRLFEGTARVEWGYGVK